MAEGKILKLVEARREQRAPCLRHAAAHLVRRLCVAKMKLANVVGPVRPNVDHAVGASTPPKYLASELMVLEMSIVANDEE